MGVAGCRYFRGIMRFPHIVLASLSAILAFSAPATAQSIDYERLDARLSRLADDQDIVGLSVAVIDRGEIAFSKGYGVTEAGGPPVTDETVFRWASLSKGVIKDNVPVHKNIDIRNLPVKP